MANAVAYGSLTLIDITDLGDFSIQPMSNLPLSVIYDPDQDNFTPNWGTSNLTITPAVYYAGEPVALGSTGLTVTWALQNGTSGSVDITDSTGAVKSEYATKGYTSTNGTLGIAQNQFVSSSTMITYIVTATYIEPTSLQELTAQGQITYTLVRNASTAETCYITGDSVFKYNTSGTLVGEQSITLTAKVNNVTVSEWQYQNGSGNWVKYPGSGTGLTLTVNATDSTFNNDKCLIRLTTSDNDVYDLHTIMKLRDGAAGSATVSAVLTNDDQSVPVNGGVADYSAAVSRIIIYNGGIDDTANWSISISASTGVTYTSSTTTVNNDTIAVTGMASNSGTVTFTCSKSGEANIIKTFSVLKVTSGADGVSPTIYSIEADAYALNKDVNNTFSPASVTFSSYEYTGTTKAAYAGMMQIFENITLAEYDAAATKPTPDYASVAAETSHSYTPSTSATSILCLLYEAGAFTNRVDTQLVVITSDGATGETGATGPQGKSAVNVVLGNYADVLTCTSSNTLQAAQTIKIPFSAYEGTTKIPCTFTSVNLLGVAPNPIGTSDTSSKNATATQDGQIVYTFPAGMSIANASGILSITFTAQTSDGNVSVVENYSWSRNTAARDGVNAVLLQIFTPSGSNTIDPSVAYVDLQAQLTDGSTDVTTLSGTTWKWYKFQNSIYQELSGKTTYTLRVMNADVESYASYKCEAHYNGTDYVAYFSVFDKTDPIQVAVLSSVGTQLVNGMGAGGIYAKVSRNGAEIDEMKTERFFTENPATAKSGDYYYKVDETNKTITLMKYTTSWAEAPSSDSTFTGTYRWTWRDKDGNTVTEINGNTLPSTGKLIYIDGSMVDKKIIADVEVII